MPDYKKIRTRLERELETEWDKVNGEMCPSLVCNIKDLLCAIKDAATIEAMDESDFGEDENSEEGGYSSARGRKRNSMGQYSRDNGGKSYRYSGTYPYYPMSGRRHIPPMMRYYSRDDGRAEMIAMLHSKLNMEDDPETREAFEHVIRTLEME